MCKLRQQFFCDKYLNHEHCMTFARLNSTFFLENMTFVCRCLLNIIERILALLSLNTVKTLWVGVLSQEFGRKSKKLF